MYYNCNSCTHLYNTLLDIPTFTPSSAILFPGQEVVFMCNTTAAAFVWIIDTMHFFGNQLQPEDGVYAINTTLFINESMNGTLYGCGSVIGGEVTSSEKSIVFVAGQLIELFLHMHIHE